MAKVQKKLDLALQGGGSHGAFTWGVLDRLLEEEDIEIDGISGTSAGAMNAVILVAGFAEGGRVGAKKALDAFWHDVSMAGSVFSPFRQTALDRAMHGWNLDKMPGYNFFDLISRLFSPYELNPFNLNPLKAILQRHLPIEIIQSCSDIKLFIAATNVQTGQARIFKCDEITVDAVLASACIPFLFQAVEIDGEPYWDGGYMGNPVIWPLVYETSTADVLLVRINPLFRRGTPKKAMDIINRLNEINFNSSLLAEMRAIGFVSKLIKDKKLNDPHYKDMLLHMVALPTELSDLDASSKLNTSFDFFLHLKEAGRNAMSEWLIKHKADIGVKGTVDVAKNFLKNPHYNKKISEF
ncbi:MAG: patatin-like phospholipase family protein [Alphaproteobacteria bacterium]